mmetsp:Transcript_26034/g.57285  ORF Transcript_26034/g.57285 Transcript_26034/m.57285 type:complete len:81 (-) Transcript_26034:1046-1288(-)
MFVICQVGKLTLNKTAPTIPRIHVLFMYVSRRQATEQLIAMPASAILVDILGIKYIATHTPGAPSSAVAQSSMAGRISFV